MFEAFDSIYSFVSVKELLIMTVNNTFGFNTSSILDNVCVSFGTKDESINNHMIELCLLSLAGIWPNFDNFSNMALKGLPESLDR